jgi:hypothetical protein
MTHALARTRRLGTPRLRLILPGLLTAYLAMDAGGFFPGTVGIATVVMALLLMLRVTTARSPVAGWGRGAALVGGAGALLASWVLASALWSGAPIRAVVEFDRVLLYLLGFALMATFPRRTGDVSVALRWVLLAIVATAIVGLATRLYPDVFSVTTGREPSRLAHPLTYWNALSVLCALGAVLALHAGSGEREPAAVRVAAVAALPVLAVAGYFPFSRGGIATAVIGALAYVALARPRRLLPTLVTAGPAVAVAIVTAYGAEALATDAYARAPGPEQGRHVALVVLLAAAGAALARLALLPLERRLDAVRLAPGVRRALPAVGVGAALAVVALALALDAPDRARAQYDEFVEGNVVQVAADTRARLGAAGNNGRLDIWRVDLRQFSSAPVIGSGAGTFQLAWERERPADIRVVDGHSLYLETAAELGVMGLALLAIVLIGLLAGPARLLASPERHAAAAVLAAGVALLVHAGIDWDWEMPALFAWLFMAAGAACALPAGTARRAAPGRLARVLAGLACLLLAVTPLTVVASQSRLQTAGRAFERGDCATAVDASLASLDVLGVRPEPFELIGYCDLRTGRPELAIAAMEAARRRDPDAWQYAYGLAVARALAGGDPRPAIEAALQLNPRDERVRDLARAFDTDRPQRWRREAARAQLPF